MDQRIGGAAASGRLHQSHRAIRAVVLGWTILALCGPATAQEGVVESPSTGSGFDPGRVLGVLVGSSRGGDPQSDEVFLGLATPLEVDKGSGAASSVIGIDLPRGRNGLTPRLAVTYSSNGGDGLFGNGWSLSLAQIRRGTREGVPFEYDNNPSNPYSYPVPGDAVAGAGDYVLELDGAQIWLDAYLGDAGGGNHAFGSAAEESFLRVWFNPGSNRWMVRTKSGVEYTFGAGGAETRTGADVNSAARTNAWGVTRIEDTNGNRIDVSYASHGVSGSLNRYLYPLRLDWGGNTAAGLSHVFSARLVYPEILRLDQRVNYIGGFEQRIDKLVDSIRVFVDEIPLRTYTFSYENDPLNGASRLTGVGARGRDSTAAAQDGIALPPTTFEYAQPPTGFRDSETWPISPTTGIDSVRGYFSGETMVDLMDLNGDGMLDRLWPDLWNTTGWRNVGDGHSDFDDPNAWDTTVASVFSVPLGQAILDMNGDSLPDQVQTAYSNWTVWYGNGRGWDAPSSWLYPGPEHQLQKVMLAASGVGLYDYNGDRRPDRVMTTEAGSTVRFNTGNGFSSVALPNPWGGPPSNNPFGGAYDMNGDGLADEVIPDIAQPRWNVYLNTGQGFLSTPVSWVFPGLSGAPS